MLLVVPLRLARKSSGFVDVFSFPASHQAHPAEAKLVPANKLRLVSSLVLRPIQVLRDAIDLVVVPSVGKLHELPVELLQPRGFTRDVHASPLDQRRDGSHARDLVAVGIERPDVRKIGRALVTKIVDEICTVISKAA